MHFRKKMAIHFAITLMAPLSFLGTINQGYAGTVSANPQATATLAKNCSFSVEDVVFGSYNPVSSDYQTQTQNVLIQCTKGTSYSISGNGGSSKNGTSAAMKNASDSSSLLRYSVFANDNVWTDDLNESVHWFHGTGTGSTQTLAISYRLLPNQYVSPGSYSDSNYYTITF